MSNTQVGTVYSRIIEEVVKQCAGPFEEEGAAASVLDDFKKTWQQRISERKVADMPWDPKPQPVPAVQPPPQPRTAAPYVPPQSQQHQQLAAAQIDVKPKIETDLANLPSAQPPYTLHNPDLARERAAAQIRSQYGQAADASLQQMNQRMPEPAHGVKRPLPQSSPVQEQFDSKRRITEDYNRSQQEIAQQRLQQLHAPQTQGQPRVGNAQTDGAADWAQMVAERRALFAEGSAAADLSIAERVAALQRLEEGNGTMQPHSKQNKAPRAIVPIAGPSSGPAAFDGVDDDDENSSPQVDDADAINSDLDDDDEEDDLVEDDDERAGEIMVCTYEKVARVKNKWKCTLKDGILITGGKEYVFNKATGEFEW